MFESFCSYRTTEWTAIVFEIVPKIVRYLTGPDSTFKNLGLPSSAFISHTVLLQNMESSLVWGKGWSLCNNGSVLMCHFTDLKMMGCNALLFSRYFPTFRNIPVVVFTIDEKDSSTPKYGTVTSSKLLYLSIYLSICLSVYLSMYQITRRQYQKTVIQIVGT